jgi:hypothetical protein
VAAAEETDERRNDHRAERVKEEALSIVATTSIPAPAVAVVVAIVVAVVVMVEVFATVNW